MRSVGCCLVIQPGMTRPINEQDKDYLKALGVKIRTLRKEQGHTLRVMVVEFGFHDSQWRKYEAGGGLTLQSLIRVAQALGTTPSALLEGIPFLELPKPS